MSLSDEERKELLRIARETLNVYLAQGKMPHITTSFESLNQPRDAFVTLRKRNGDLRGCIGTVRAPKPLLQNVEELTISSAVRDPRFPSLSQKELEDIVIEISVLSSFHKIGGVSEIVAGVHGVLLEHEGRSGVFLPQVATEQGWGVEELLNNLCAYKAGLPKEAWKRSGAALYIFTAEYFMEEENDKKQC